MRLIALVAAAFFVIVTSASLLFSSYERVPDGNVGILTEWGRVTGELSPGFHWKNPISEDVILIEIRERRSSPAMSVSAQGVAISATVSFNWAVRPDAARRIFVEYKSVAQFEERAVIPIFQQAVKSVIGAVSVSDLIRTRGEVASRVEIEVRKAMERLPIAVSSLQIDDFSLPPSILAAAENRVKAEQDTEAAEQRLRLQAVEAQQAVQLAEAEAQATEARANAALVKTRAEAEGNLAIAEAEAIGIRAIGQAKADALRAEADALTANPTLVELERARRWGGEVPGIVIGENSGTLPFLDIARMGERK